MFRECKKFCVNKKQENFLFFILNIVEYKHKLKRVEEVKKQAKEQIEEYANFEEIKQIERLNKYRVVAVNDKLYLEKI